MPNDRDFDAPANPYVPPSGSRPGVPQVGPIRPARVRFGAIGDGWHVAGRNRGTWALVFLIFLVTEAVLGGFHKYTTQRVGGKEGVNVDINVGSSASGILGFIVNTYLMAGAFRMACRQVRGERIEVADLFAANDAFLPALLGNLLVILAAFGWAALVVFALILVGLTTHVNFVAIAITVVVVLLIGVAIAGRLMFLLPLIADGRMGPTQAFGASWRALRGQSLQAFLFVLVTGIVSGIGYCLCVIGYLWTGPIYYLAIAILYHEFFVVKPAATPWVEPA